MQIDDEYCCGNCDDCPYYEVVDNSCLLVDVLTSEE